jgi:hypothetical protein
MVSNQKGRRGVRLARLNPYFVFGGIGGPSSATGKNERGMQRFRATQALFLEDDADWENTG